MQRVLSMQRMGEAAPHMDPKTLQYLNEGQIESFESFEEFSLIAFDWYDVHSNRTQNEQMLLYLDREDLFIFCEDRAAEDKANAIFREVTADVDEVKLSLALNNLVENAIKYNVEGGWVRVTNDADHKFFYVKVADSGIGISEEFQEHIFERFYRVDKARSRETGGTGLGLAITKNIILMHQGAIRLTSKEGEGTTFTVRIPLTYIP